MKRPDRVPVLLVICALTAWVGCRPSSATKRVTRSDPDATVPFLGKPHLIPGKIEAEHFDRGKEGSAYHDAELQNLGKTNSFRATGVDIKRHEERDSGGYRVGFLRAGEWLAYTVNVQRAGTYTVEVATETPDRTGGIFHLEFSGQDKTGPVQLPEGRPNADPFRPAGDPTYRVFENKGVKLEAGRYTMTLVVDKNGESGGFGDIDYIRFIDEREPPEERTNTLEVRIIDVETGMTTPSMVCIRNLDDGSVRLPPDGRVQTKTDNFFDLENGTPFDPNDRNWIGPVLKMEYPRLDEAGWPNGSKGQNALPYWEEPVSYQTSGNFSVRLPDGRFRIAVEHGMEYVPVVEEFEIRGGRTIERRIELKRWINLAEQGWYSGDTHVHHPTTNRSDRQYLLSYCEAEDVHVCNMLEWSHHYRWEASNPHSLFQVNGFGEQFRTSRGEFWLVSGQEDSNHFGCIIGLNIGGLVPYTEETDGLCDHFYEGWHSRREAVVGWPHFGSWSHDTPGLAWSITTGHIEFVELMQQTQYKTKEYYEYLDLGFKIAAAAGSDFAWGATVGETRVYVYTGTPLDIDKWFANLKKGHTFATNGPALEFTVDGKLPGSEIEKKPGETVSVVARVLGHPKVALPKVLTIEGTHGVIKQVTNENKNSELSLAFELPVEKSQWIAAHTVATNGSVAHTTPVYVLVNGEPSWNLEKGPEIARDRIRKLREVEQAFSAGTDPRSQQMVSKMQKAIGAYDDLLNRMKEAGSPAPLPPD